MGSREKPGECESKSCDKPPTYEVAYTETSPYYYRWLCTECKTMERIHDPVGTKITTAPSDMF
jgi:hypothetical protein